MEKGLKEQFKNAVAEAERMNPVSGRVWLTTSGTSNVHGGSGKLLAHSKEAFLVSAEAVCKHLDVQQKDTWGIALPNYHVGGLSIEARAYVSNTKFKRYSGPWSPRKFSQFLREENITITSLVPTQVYDLVAQQVESPASLRALIVGGAALSEKLYLKARKLGWPLLPSYGMTETCSQIATAELKSLEREDFPLMKVLSHAQVRVTSFVEIQSNSLLSFYVFFNKEKIEIYDPKIEGWFVTEDLGETQNIEQKFGGLFLKIFGRSGQFVKIKGEGVHLDHLEKLLNELMVEKFSQLVGQCFLKPVTNERLGAELILYYSGDLKNVEPLEELRQKFNSHVLKHERINRTEVLADGKGALQFKNILVR